MRGVIGALLSALAIFFAPTAYADERSEMLDKQAYELYQQVFSPFCPGRSLNDCPSSKAHELKDEMRGKLEQGVPPQAILDEVFARFGDQYRAVPTYQGFGKLVWWAPIGFLAIGLLVAILVVLGRRRGEPVRPREGKPALSDSVQAEIDRELSSFD